MSTFRDRPPDESPPPTLPGVLMALASLIIKREAVLWVAAVVVLLAAGAGSVVWAQAQLDGGTGKAIAPLAARVDDVDAKLDAHLDDDRQSKRETKQVMSELAADIRALYRAQMTGQPQARLERPPQLPDGGP